jgi:ligand-binding SRPBCC domain-containing protein
MFSAVAHLEVSSIIPAARAEVFDYACDPYNLPEMLRGQIDIIVESNNVPLKKGSEFQFTMARYGMSQRVRLVVEDYVRGSRLAYRQVEGLFQSWTHVIRCEEQAPKQTLITNLVDYQVPLGILGHLADDLYVKRDMRSVLETHLERIRQKFEVSPSEVS